MSQKIVVKKNAPGWPAMVSTKFSANQKAIRDQIKAIKEADSHYERVTGGSNASKVTVNSPELEDKVTGDKGSAMASAVWLRKRSNRATIGVATSAKPSPFAPKLVRQCGNCQMLYTNFHACQESDTGDAFCVTAHHK